MNVRTRQCDSHLKGDAGEHQVISWLENLGIYGVQTSRGSKDVDILATVDGSKSMAIQVKASAGRNNCHRWAVGKRRPNSSESFFFVFVNIWDDPKKTPDFFVVPSAEVATRVNWKASMPVFSVNKNRQNDWSAIKGFFGLS